jgi:hypothetical protein
VALPISPDAFPSEVLPLSPPIHPRKSVNDTDYHVSNFSEQDPQNDYDNCKAVVDCPLTDAQGNPGRYTGIVSIHLLDDRQAEESDPKHALLLKPHGVGRMVYADGKRIHEGEWYETFFQCYPAFYH